MQTIPNVATQDTYQPELTLGPNAVCRGIKYVVANAAVFAQVAPLDRAGTLQDWGEEVLITPETNSITAVGGIRFRSAVAGVPARVVAQLYLPADPQFGSGTPFTGALSSSGGVQPGVSNVRVQQNGALIGTEPTIDFESLGPGLGLAVTDDPANTRVKVTAPQVITGRGTTGPAAVAQAGSGFTMTPGATGIATINFTTAFAASPVLVASLVLFGAGMVQFDQSLPGSCVIRTYNAAGALTDATFYFTAWTVH